MCFMVRGFLVLATMIIASLGAMAQGNFYRLLLDFHPPKTIFYKFSDEYRIMKEAVKVYGDTLTYAEFFNVLCCIARQETFSDASFFLLVDYAVARGWSLDGTCRHDDVPQGFFLLRFILLTKQYKKMRYLLKNGANPNLIDCQGETLLDIAYHRGADDKFIKLIRRHGGITAAEALAYLHDGALRATVFKIWQ